MMFSKRVLFVAVLFAVSPFSTTAQGACSNWGKWCNAGGSLVVAETPCVNGEKTVTTVSDKDDCKIQKRKCKDSGSTEWEWRSYSPPMCPHNTDVGPAPC